MKRSSPKLIGAIVLLNFDSSLLELFKSNNYNIKIKKQSLKFKEGKRPYLLACCNVRWRDLNLEMNKNHILYTLKP
jgi:hypothetical protein